MHEFNRRGVGTAHGLTVFRQLQRIREAAD
jgi:hypothetical protein